MIKKNIKVISVFILGVVCAIGITISAYVVTSKNVLVKSTGWNVKNVEEAVSYLKDEDKCTGMYPKPAKVISGDVNTIGSIVQIGDEEFYVVGQGTGTEVGKIKLLAKNTINVNNNAQSSGNSGSCYTFSASMYWSGSSSSGSYVYNENSNIYQVVENYVAKIKNQGINDASGRLLSYEEAQTLTNEIKKPIGASGYWLGTTVDAAWKIWNVYDRIPPSIEGTDYNDCRGIRPVILVPTNKIG